MNKPQWIFFNDKFTGKSIMAYVLKETEEYVYAILCDDPKEQRIKVAKSKITCTMEEL